ncbi:NEDD8-conjugating enzyme Ubc12-like protein [Tanacetum coccineum]
MVSANSVNGVVLEAVNAEDLIKRIESRRKLCLAASSCGLDFHCYIYDFVLWNKLPCIMIKLFKVKERQRELAENSNGKPPVKKQSAGELRLHKDISELNLPKTCSISFPNGKDDLMNFEVTIRPDDGYYVNGTFTFTFQISSIYPHEAPKVKCKTKVYHPNIDLDGNVCLNILREDWKPVLNINTIIYGLYHLFTEPNHEDPLNREAAAVLRDNPKMFESNVRRAMAGGYVGQTFFTSVTVLDAIILGHLSCKTMCFLEDKESAVVASCSYSAALLM